MKGGAQSAREKRCGFAALVGRPNVGKSTLLNHLLKQKISITSRKPQTTRHRILGIVTEDDTQIVFIDTPGFHSGGGRTLNRLMNETVEKTLRDVDVVLFLVDRLVWTDEDDRMLELVKKLSCPVLLLINKCDLIPEKGKLLPHIERLAQKMSFAEIVPVSALKGHNLENLEELVGRYLPEGEFLFPADQVTDRSQRFLAAEMIREKITRQLGDEVPYATTVEIESFKAQEGVLHIDALILVERSGQKRILIGKDGSRLKTIGQAARRDMENSFDSRVMLRLWVKTRSGWADNERALQSLGYTD